MLKSKKIVIIGGGASGMVAAIKAKQTNPIAEVIICDRMKQLGKKLLATGNGKGNFSNIKASPKYYNDSTFVEHVFSKVSLFDVIRFFGRLGIFAKNDAEGRMYPYSDQASAIHDSLLIELERLGVKVELETNVTQIIKQNEKFEIIHDHGMISCDKVIMAAGGKAYPNLGSNGSGYDLIKQLGHTITPIFPSLVGMKIKESTKQLGGIRIKGVVTLKSRDVILGTEDGEIQLRETGLSGIVMMQMSVIIARRKVLGLSEPYTIGIDMLPTLHSEDVIQILNERYEALKNRELDSFFIGMFHQQIGRDILKRIGIVDLKRKVSTLSKYHIGQLASIIKDYKFEFEDFYTFDDAQVCSGGVINSEVSSTSLESKLIKGLFIVGELLNVDGETGGYNLQWAWASGILAGMCAAQDD